MKISELIKSLEHCKKELGDLPIAISKDEEMNHVSSLDEEHIWKMDNCVCLVASRKEFDVE